jgi:response regulator RpfG family c-di-GMP phosphodiesterase
VNGQSLPRVLCVDDEPLVVEWLDLHLCKDYEVHTALSGPDALRQLSELGGTAVVISDMRMPDMDGAVLLQHVMRGFPDTTRILLTGDPGRDAAVSAVNHAQIFRFLTKPCPPDQLRVAVEAAVIQHRLVNAEHSILQETLIGCIKTLVDVLAITNPIAFGRASRVKQLAMEVAEQAGCRRFWQLEAAALLSQLGYISLPPELAEKVYYGKPITPEERTLVAGAPRLVTSLLENIPRLEPVVQIVNALNSTDEALLRLGDGSIGLGSRILDLVLYYDTLITQGHTISVAMQTLRGRSSRFGESLIEIFAAHVGGASSRVTREMPLRTVKPGMIIMQDVRTPWGMLLVPRGFEATQLFLERIRNFGPDLMNEPVKVTVERENPGGAA